MKRIIILLFLLPLLSKAQVYQAMPQAGYGPVKRIIFDSVLTLPLGITKLQNITGGRDTGQIRYNKADSSIYIYSGNAFRKVSSTDTTSLSNRIDNKLGSINSLTGAAQTMITGTDSLDFKIVSTGTQHKFNIPSASATKRGLLSIADWSTFSNKVSKSGDVMSGGLTINGGTIIANSVDDNHAEFGNGKVVISNAGQIITGDPGNDNGNTIGNNFILTTKLDAYTTTNSTAITGYSDEGIHGRFGGENGFTVTNSGRTLIGTPTDNTIDKLQVNGNIVADTLKKKNGTSLQFLKADGSSDATVYATTTTAQTITGAKTYSPTVTASGLIARGTYLTPTLNAAANFDQLVGLDINPTFNANGFSSTKNLTLRLTNGGTIGTNGNTGYNIYLAGNEISLNSPAGFIGFQNAGINTGRFMTTTGNLVLQNGGTFTDNGDRLQVSGNINLTTAGNKLKIATGSNASAGTATLVAGTIVVTTTAVTASSIILLTAQNTGISTGNLRVSAKTAGTFTILSTSAADTCPVGYVIIN